MEMSEQTKIAIDDWISDINKDVRYKLLKALAEEADLEIEFQQVPKIHFELMDYDKYMIHVYALAKIRSLVSIGDNM
jgi:hypothetical protein